MSTFLNEKLSLVRDLLYEVLEQEPESLGIVQQYVSEFSGDKEFPHMDRYRVVKQVGTSKHPIIKQLKEGAELYHDWNNATLIIKQNMNMKVYVPAAWMLSWINKGYLQKIGS